MSKVITFSKAFPSYHQRKGEPTYFVEKIWESLILGEEISISKCCELSRQTGIGEYTMNTISKIKFDPKHHTIRAGHRFKEGDWFSPRVWSGKPYRSKQIIIAPDIQVKKVLEFEIKHFGILDQCLVTIDNVVPRNSKLTLLANNDGLSFQDFNDWFVLSPSFVKLQQFNGQIICWNEDIEY
jgi:hypothetical protein